MYITEEVWNYDRSDTERGRCCVWNQKWLPYLSSCQIYITYPQGGNYKQEESKRSHNLKNQSS